jgi:nucleotide-binding universal stress UspA family protein
MFERILLPLDGSESSEIAVPYAEELARAFGSDLVLYHTHPEEHRHQEHMHRVYLESLAASVQARVNLVGVTTTASKMTVRVEVGEPAGSICNLVEKDAVDLVVMAAVSASGIEVGRMLGSVTDHVCRTVPVPVLLIRPQNVNRTGGKERLISRLLIPVDGSDLSKLALPFGEELAGKLKAGVTLFQMARMIRVYDDGSGFNSYVNYTQFDEDEKARVSAEMSALENAWKRKGLQASSVVTSGLDAAVDIIEVGKKVSADLVVMSTHGRSGLTRWVLGNVAERILRHGETPLLLVHARAG